MKISISICAAAMISIAAMSCNSNKKDGAVNTPQATIVKENDQFGYTKGQRVPNDKVCMVNDAFMGKEQIEVPLDGKMYYGCCNMCKERIPKDEKVRYAVDPLTGGKVDKASSYIVLVGNNGEVAYFADEKNYQNFLKVNPAL